MAYTLPNFVSTLDWWKPGSTPLIAPPNLSTPGQIYEPSRSMFVSWDAFVSYDFVYQQIRLPLAFYQGPPMTIFSSIFGWKDSFATEWYYVVRWWDVVHQDFGNAYILTYCLQCDNAGGYPDLNR